ncbi:hypothetical protein [Bacillus sp. Brlt_9]|uniref:hypothetical protein n=1 Tax=Bacillus sp. Brlt_9 TaxID=3110916 RepID=UPI003F7B93E7
MTFANIFMISFMTLIGYKILELFLLMILMQNIDKIKQRKKGFIYELAKMKLGEKFSHL